MLVQQDLLDETLRQVQASKTIVHDTTPVDTCTPRCDYVSWTAANSLSMTNVERDIGEWQRAVDTCAAKCESIVRGLQAHHSSCIPGIESELNEWRSAINDAEGIWRRNMANASIVLKTDFNIDGLLAQVESKRRAAEVECNRIQADLHATTYLGPF